MKIERKNYRFKVYPNKRDQKPYKESQYSTRDWLNTDMRIWLAPRSDELAICAGYFLGHKISIFEDYSQLRFTSTGYKWIEIDEAHLLISSSPYSKEVQIQEFRDYLDKHGILWL